MLTAILTALLALPAASPSAWGEGLITRTERPPNLESPLVYFNKPFTPNDQFFVRRHLAGIPEIDPNAWKLEVGGESVEHPFFVTLEELKKLPRAEVVALALCAGNRRGFFEPHVPGVQWGPGGMGNARWQGVRLKDLLERAGLKPGALEVVFDGADTPVMKGTPDFVKSLPLAKALDPDTLIAWQMNGADLPKLQGFPARLVVPGWVATYWVQSLTSIRVVSKPFDGFWMKSAYRIPKEKFPALEGGFPSQAGETNVPITEIAIASMVTNLAEGAKLPPGKPFRLQGVAWDGGHGIDRVEVSLDRGKLWRKASLGKSYGKYSWRQFFFSFTPAKDVSYDLKVRATNVQGQAQDAAAVANPGGYHFNAIQEIRVTGNAAGAAVVENMELPAGPGRDKVIGNCVTCHSLDYLRMHAFLDRKGWEAEVKKMKLAMGAPISDEDFPVIVEYLSRSLSALK